METKLDLQADRLEPMTEGDVAAYLRYHPNRSFMGCTVAIALIFWIPLSILLHWATDSWMPAMAAGILPVAGIVIGARRDRARSAKAVAEIRGFQVRVMEGMVQDYQMLEGGRPADKSKSTHWMRVGGVVVDVTAADLVPVRIGALVQVRYLDALKTCLKLTVMEYRRHGLDHQVPPMDWTDEIEITEVAEFQAVNREFAGQRILTGGIVLFLLVAGSIVGGILYLVFGWGHWLEILGVVLLGLIALFVSTGRSLAKPQKNMLENARKRVVTGILSARWLSAANPRDALGYWTIGDHRYLLQLKYFVLAEPGDRVRLHFMPDDTHPYRVERLAMDGNGDG